MICKNKIKKLKKIVEVFVTLYYYLLLHDKIKNINLRYDRVPRYCGLLRLLFLDDDDDDEGEYDDKDDNGDGHSDDNNSNYNDNNNNNDHETMVR